MAPSPPRTVVIYPSIEDPPVRNVDMSRDSGNSTSPPGEVAPGFEERRVCMAAKHGVSRACLDREVDPSPMGHHFQSRGEGNT